MKTTTQEIANLIAEAALNSEDDNFVRQIVDCLEDHGGDLQADLDDDDPTISSEARRQLAVLNELQTALKPYAR